MNFDTLTKQDIEEIFYLCLDSKKQKELIENTNHKDCWMLEFVFNKKLLDELEQYVEVQKKTFTVV